MTEAIYAIILIVGNNSTQPYMENPKRRAEQHQQQHQQRPFTNSHRNAIKSNGNVNLNAANCTSEITGNGHVASIRVDLFS